MAVATPAPERAAGRRILAAKGLALADGSFPVPDAAHWDKAREAIGRVADPAKRAQVAALLRKTAPRFGRTQALGESWAAPGGNGSSDQANPDLGIYLADGPEPYHRDADENVQCPACGKYNDADARYCDQCGSKLPASAFADLSNPLTFSETLKDDQGQTLTCPECDYSGPASRFGANGAGLQAKPGVLRTPAGNTAQARAGAPLTVRGGSARTLSNTGTATELAGPPAGRRHPVSSPLDVLVTRGDNGAVIRHRQGGGEIAQIRRNGDGTWNAVMGGKNLPPHTHQRAALMEAVGTWNKSLSAPRPQASPLMPSPVQTPLMQQYGIPAVKSAAFANPATSSASGPRVTMAAGSGKYDPDGDGDNDATVAGDTDKDGPGGLSPRGQAIYKKLTAKGFPPARALAFARNAEKRMNAAGKAA